MKIGDPVITEGVISADVTEVQKILQGQGYNVGPIDGNFGPQTKAAVIAFQKSKGLMPDGIVGPDTWNALKGNAVIQQIVPVVSQPAKPEPPPVSMLANLFPPLALGLIGIGLVFFQSGRR